MDFLDAALVAAAFEGGFEEGFEDGFEVGFGSEFLRERQHVGVVVETGQIGHVFVNGQTGADTFDFVYCYVHPVPRPADGDAALGFTIGHKMRGFEAEVGIIDRVLGVGAEVDDFVAHLFQNFFDFVFEFEAGVVGGEGDFHLIFLFTHFNISSRSKPPWFRHFRRFFFSPLRVGEGLGEGFDL